MIVNPTLKPAVRFVFPLFIFFFSMTFIMAQSNSIHDTLVKSGSKDTIYLGKHKFFLTNIGFGGTALRFSKFNDQLAIMNGGRGAATINHKLTIGGGGYGIVNRIKLESNSPDTFNFVKMGYGGLELGYILYPGKKMNVGISILLAGGAAFKESLPKVKGNAFSVFPVLEPSVYSEFFLGRLIRIQAGVSYRYMDGSKLAYMKNSAVNGFSCYVNLLFGSCVCDG